MVFRKERGFDRKSTREEWKPPVTGPAPEGGFVFERQGRQKNTEVEKGQVSTQYKSKTQAVET
jgi:hypothetical protein